MGPAIAVRPARCEDAAGIARVHVESWRTTYQGIVPEDYLRSLSIEAREKEWQPVVCAEPRRAFVFVANDAERVVGFVSAGRARANEWGFQGELYAIYVLETHQRRGIGRRLVREVAANLARADMNSMMLWVLAANPACRFYEALGGKRFGSQPFTIGGVTLEEIAHGWDDVRQLLLA